MTHNHEGRCEGLVRTNGLPPTTDCETWEELNPSMLVGDDQETATPGVPAHVARVKVYHENRQSRAESDCTYAQDRIFHEETLVELDCEYFDLGTTEIEQGTDNGWDDLVAWLDHYYDTNSQTNHGHRSGTESWNGGRFVLLLVNENHIQRPASTEPTAGWGKVCDSDWTTTTRTDTCGHGLVYNRGGTEYFRHSGAYREGQTFAHEIIHVMGVIGTGVKGHDSAEAYKNYNGDEGCSGSGDDFLSHNVFEWSAHGTACDHRHFWLSTDIETKIETAIPDHEAEYP